MFHFPHQASLEVLYILSHQEGGVANLLSLADFVYMFAVAHTFGLLTCSDSAVNDTASEGLWIAELALNQTKG